MEIKLYQDTCYRRFCTVVPPHRGKWPRGIIIGSRVEKRRDKRETCYKVVREKGAREAFLFFLLDKTQRPERQLPTVIYVTVYEGGKKKKKERERSDPLCNRSRNAGTIGGKLHIPPRNHTTCNQNRFAYPRTH